MGTVFPRQSDNMKLFAVLALAAVAFAEPEAEGKAEGNPALLYGTYGYGVPYAGAYGAYGAYSAYHPAAYGGYYYGKRSAEAEPEGAADANADAYYRYYGYARPYAYGAGYGYRTYGAYPYAPAYYGKRSAEAEPEAEADPAVLYSTASIASPLTTAYTAGVAPLTTAYTHAVASPLTYTTAVNTVVPTVSQYKWGVYGGYPAVYGGYPAVYGKRSADGEADAEGDARYLLYTAGVAPYAAYSHVAAPLAYTHAAQYTVPVATVAKAPAHGVASTYAGLVHSSHVGVCLNNVGVQVPC